MTSTTERSERSPLRRLLRYVRGHRNVVRKSALSSVINKLLDLAPPLLIGLAVDVVLQQEESPLAALGLHGADAQLAALAGLTFVVWGLESVFEYMYKLGWRNLAQTVQHELRLDAYGKVQGMDLAFFEDRSTGGLMSVLNDDVNQLERFLDTGANELLQVTTTALAIGATFFWLAPEVAWMAMLPMPFILWGSVAYQRRLAPRYARVRDEVGLLNADLAGHLGGIATIKSFTAEERELERIGQRSEAYRQANAHAIRLSSAFSPLIRMVVVCGFTATLYFGGKLAWSGELSIGSYSVLVFLTQRLLWPLTRLGETFDLYQRAMASTQRVMDLLDLEPSFQEGERVLPVRQVPGEVCFEHVDFRYSTGTDVLRDIDLRLAAGSTVAFVGSTGSGKSTLVKLCLRFYDPTAGRVTLDGVDLRDLELESLRQAFGLVSQDVFLFHGTVRENIAYGRPDATEAELIAAAHVAEADEFIRALPEGYDTFVGERGQKLSGGQRQRISIARAVLKDPPILILDEATSAVDNETEAAIQRSFERISEGRTTIVIAHRLSTIRKSNRIIVLEAGRIAEQGTHEELVAGAGLYAALWRVQTGEALT